ncbi:valyl-tRNA synthetase [Anaerobacterium chartisolvens]|uniref:Valine--tRNA ligase n=1 Tax=Anaerobacterium chartisolvens TaxID=1297424 RepID=A0A369B7L7_9FIRM|nr:valine--tRNA ligase [Anaerobacterium chartisolvens]RCX17513.1 valyl-tRNA synthetase [Anaerobacterium chartisolvens]
MDKNIAKTYDPKQVEDRLYEEWTNKGYFHAQADENKKPFTIVIPPPNITGQLHMGHALDNTLQDILIRWKRMQGYSTLWLPGTDHASIATEAKIVDAMAKEGLTKDMLGREKFLERAWEWKTLYGGRIVNQLKKLGSSCDWQRERFTMDEGLSEAVKEVFLRLYKKGLIYRGERITNWCPSCNTSISDIEVEYEEKEGSFWHIRYPVKDTGEYVVIATTRPETMLGDTAVAVHPEDERYSHLVGKKVVLPLINREIPVIADSYVEKDFGTGVVKITPAHDPNDFEVGLRHGLKQIRVMTDKGRMNEEAGQYAGMDRYEARGRIVEDLKELDLLVKVQPHTHNVGTCQRCSTVVEPLISKQWYVKMKPLAEPAIEVVKNGTVRFVPDRFSKIYFNWMENIQDWCISRQLWWGHRIPAYYCLECGNMMVESDMPDVCPKCGSSRIQQDADTLDTWFSSALWPFSTLGWPENTEDLKYFYPTDVLVTGYDIIFFWVARMIFSGVEHMEKEPFKHVLIHGLVRDAQGRKMSKSLGNGIDPLDVIEQYGTDALRFAISIGNSPGNDLRFSTDKIESSRNFANKIWNASRFVLMNFEEGLDFSKVDPSRLTSADKWILSRVNTLIKEVTENLERFELGIALQKVYEFIWEEFCDWYIELVKPRLYDSESAARLEAQFVLNYVLGSSMKLLHPYMPFITEEIYTHLINEDDSIMISSWPEYKEEYSFPGDEEKLRLVMESIRSIRNIRAEMNVPPSKKARVIFVASHSGSRNTLEETKGFFERLGGASEVVVQDDKTDIPEDAVAAIIEGAEIFIPLNELIDLEKEQERLEKEKANLEKELARVDGKLNNPGFTSKAPAKVIEEERAKQQKYRDMYEKVAERLASLRK